MFVKIEFISNKKINIVNTENNTYINQCQGDKEHWFLHDELNILPETYFEPVNM
jgi:hypothetical protein